METKEINILERRDAREEKAGRKLPSAGVYSTM